MLIDVSTKTFPKMFVLIDDEDYPRIKNFTWVPSAVGRRIYFKAEKAKNRVIKRTSLHRFIMNTPKGKDTDHVNGNTLDNRKANLRVCSRSQNMANCPKQTRSTSSRFKGVFYDKAREKYVAQIKKNKKMNHLGRFEKEEDAAAAYDKAAKRIFGKFALLNNPRVVEGEI